MTRGRENIYSIHQNSKQFYRLAIFTKHVAHVGIGLRATGAATLRNLAWPRREEVALVTIILRLDQGGGYITQKLSSGVRRVCTGHAGHTMVYESRN